MAQLRQGQSAQTMIESHRGRNRLMITGRDLVTIVASEEAVDTKIIAVINANPIYMQGTRAADLAKLYQNYRPIKFNVEYVPIVPVTEKGMCVIGTTWDAEPPQEALQNSLATSPGGRIFTVWQRANIRVPCSGSHLRQRLFSTMGELSDPGHNPFTVMMVMIGGMITQPGYLFLDWQFELSNPNGQGLDSRAILDGGSKLLPQECVELRFVGSNMNPANGIFGTVLKTLKVAGRSLLKNVGALVLNSVKDPLGTVVNIGTKVLFDVANSDPSHEAYNSELTRVKVGRSSLDLPDNTPCLIYSNGPAVTLPMMLAPAPPPPDPPVPDGPAWPWPTEPMAVWIVIPLAEAKTTFVPVTTNTVPLVITGLSNDVAVANCTVDSQAIFAQKNALTFNPSENPQMNIVVLPAVRKAESQWSITVTKYDGAPIDQIAWMYTYASVTPGRTDLEGVTLPSGTPSNKKADWTQGGVTQFTFISKYMPWPKPDVVFIHFGYT